MMKWILVVGLFLTLFLSFPGFSFASIGSIHVTSTDLTAGNETDGLRVYFDSNTSMCATDGCQVTAIQSGGQAVGAFQCTLHTPGNYFQCDQSGHSIVGDYFFLTDHYVGPTYYGNYWDPTSNFFQAEPAGQAAPPIAIHATSTDLTANNGTDALRVYFDSNTSTCTTDGCQVTGINSNANWYAISGAFQCTLHTTGKYFQCETTGENLVGNYYFLTDRYEGNSFWDPTSYPFQAEPSPVQVSLPATASLNQGDTYAATGSFTDTSATASTTWTATVDYGDGSGSQPLTLNGQNFSLSHTYTSKGKFTVAVFVTNNQEQTGAGTATVTVSNSNAAPTITTFADATINEGDTYASSGSFTDPDSTSWTATVDYGDGSGQQPLTLSGTNFSLNHVYKDEGAYTVTVLVTDNQGLTGAGSATVTVNNAPFTVGTIGIPSPVTQVNTAITASASYSDPGVLDTHTARWDWGDGTTSTSTVSEDNGSGSVSDSHTYTAAGVYTVTLTVTDDDGVSNTSSYQYISVYNPTVQGIFSAGQLFTSPTGADPQNPTTTGKVQFGLSYKYQGTMPVGHRQFTMNFKADNLSFNATSVSSLVIANNMATLTGTGTVNGSGNYDFLVTGVNGRGIRIQLTDPANNNRVIYDTQPGADATATPTTVVTGNVIVH